MPTTNTPPEQPPFLLLGRILRPHGIRGELRMEVLTAYPENIVPGREVFVGPDQDKPATATAYTIERARVHQGIIILQFEELADRNEAELLRNLYVMVTLDDAVPLEPGEVYIYQLIGLDVYTDEDEHLGKITDIIETGANDVFVVRGPRGEVLLPDIDECILDVDLDAGSMTVHILAGLLGD